MPPKKKQSSKGSDDRSNPSSECCVCCQDLNIVKDEAIFCTGYCQQWLHRYCAGVSLSVFKHIKEKDCQFRCFTCYQLYQQEEVTKLRNKVIRLSSLIDKFHPSSTLTTSSAPSSSYASAVVECGRNNTMFKHRAVPAPPPSNSKKYNVYGVDECASCLTRASRQEADLESVVSLFSRIDSSITSQTYPGLENFPIMSITSEVTDVHKILSKSRLIPKPYMFKPDMSPYQRQCEGTLGSTSRWDIKEKLQN